MSSKPVALRVASVVLFLVLTLVPAVHGQVQPPTSTPDPSPGIVVSKLTLAVTEGGATDTYAMHLNTVPASTVTVTVTSLNGQVRFLNATNVPVASVTRTFPAGPAALTDQTVTAIAVDDAAVEGTHSDTVKNAASGDQTYSGVVKLQTAAITDNDVGVAIAQTGADTHVSESASVGDQDQFSVLLGSAPTAPVTGKFVPGSQLSLDHLQFSFDASNWKAPQAFTVYSVDDHLAQGERTITLAATASSADPAYDGRIVSLAVHILDDDTAGLRFAAATGSDAALNTLPALAAFPEGGSITYRVHLNSQPTANVVFTPSGPAALSFTPASITFTPGASGTWNTPTAITIHDAQDSIDQGAGAYSLNVVHALSSADPSYAAAPAGTQTMPVSVTDDDLAAVLLTHAGGTPSVTEGGATDTLSVALGSQPLGPISVSVHAPSDVTFTPASLTFTPDNWNVAQPVTVAAIDDSKASLDRTVGAVATGNGDGKYNNLNSAALTINVADNDGVLVLSKASVAAVEGGTDTFKVHLVAQPTGDVTVTLVPSRPGEFSVSPAVLTFRPASPGSAPAACPVSQSDTSQAGKDCTWNLNQTVTLTARTDNVIDGNQAGTIGFTVTGGGASFNGKVTPPMPATAVDGDAPGLVLTPPSTTANEGGTATYTVALANKPTASVTVTPTGNGDLQASAPLTFTTGNWNRTQTVTVTAREDSIDKGNRYTNTVSNVATSTDVNYNNLDGGAVSVNITDNDTHGYLFSTPTETTLAADALPSTFNIAEGGSGTYSVHLRSQPTADVTITLTPDAGLTLSTSTVTFTPQTWNAVQTVTVTATDDQVQRTTAQRYDLTIAQASSSSDPNYGPGIPSPVRVHVAENDVASVVLGQSGGSTSVTEGGNTDTLTVVLATQPRADVTVSLTPPAGVTVSPSSLVFTASTWGAQQTVTLTAIDDAFPGFTNSTALTTSVASGDTIYAGLHPSVSVAKIDNDGVLKIVKAGALAAAEGGATASYTVQLIANPTSEVTVTVASRDGQVLFAPDAASTHTATLQLKFEPNGAAGANAPVPCPADPTKNCRWDNPQTVNVQAFDDSVPEPQKTDAIKNVVASSDARYGGVPTPEMPVTVTDNDAGLLFVETGSGTAVTEGGAADTYTVALSAPPTGGSVTITLASDSRMALSPMELDFDRDTWSTPQTVTVLAPDDHFDQADTLTYPITHTITSHDAAYGILGPTNLNVVVTDDDSSALVIAQSGGTTVVKEGGPGDSFTVRLATQPVSSVTVTLSPDAQVTLSPSQLTFTPANWNTAQSVAASAVDDSVAQGQRGVQVAFSVASSDAGYAALAPPSLPVTVNDNDAVGVVFGSSASNVQVTEGGSTTVYAFRLKSQPTQDVTVTMAGDSHVNVLTPTLTFTPGNWDVYQSVRVGAVDDNVHQASSPYTGTVTHTPSSADAAYQGLAIPSVTVNITDNDP